jgi:hypothetical protein
VRKELVRRRSMSRSIVVSALAVVWLSACGGNTESAEAPDQEAIRAGGSSEEGARAEEETGGREATRAAVLTAGTELHFQVTEAVSTERNDAGDVFAIRLMDDAVASGGAVVLPAGTRGLATVIEARPSADATDTAVLAFRVSSVSPGDRPVPVRGTILTSGVDAERRDSGSETAAKVGTGAAAGAILGQILGSDSRSTITGAVVGTVAGGAIAMATRDGHAVLPAGSRFTLRLDEPLSTR